MAYELPELADEADKAAELKDLAAQYRLPYDAGSIGRALDHVARRPIWIRTPTREAAPPRRIVKGFTR